MKFVVVQGVIGLLVVVSYAQVGFYTAKQNQRCGMQQRDYGWINGVCKPPLECCDKYVGKALQVGKYCTSKVECQDTPSTAMPTLVKASLL